jgi:hypothetical protein
MPWTNVQLLANVRDRTGASTYNNATYNSFNQNLVQGQIHSVSVNEVNFPYDIPNVQEGYNTFTLTPGLVAQPTLNITIAPGFYTGVELEQEINAAIIAAGAAAAPPVAPANLPTVNYAPISNRFVWNAPVSNVPNFVWYISSPVTLPFTGVGAVGPGKVGKDLFSIMGFFSAQDGDNFVDSDPIQQYTEFYAAGAAPLTFTQYIDICSPELCQFQYFRDGSTTNLARRSDVICRLYISNNVATQEEEGARPFVINRQFNNARVMRWNSGSSVGSMSIQLYDDCGQPLQFDWEPRPYNITFNVYEQDKDSLTY